MTSVDCLFLSDGDDFRLLDYTIACVRHYHSLLKESNITDDVVLSYGKDIVVNEGHVLAHRITTKYYEAQIQLKGYKLNDILRIDTTNAEGVILITNYDKTEDEEIGFWNKVKDISEVYDKDNIQFRALVLLNTTENIVEAKREKYFLWALNNSFELIDINMSKLLDTFNDREKEGLPRLIEAIEATNWSSVAKKNNDTRTSATANRQPVVTAHMNTSNDTTDESKPVVFANIPELSEPSASTYSGAEDEIMTTYSNIVEEARRLREDVMAGTVSDEERRNKAAECALKFAQMMNFDEESSDDDDH